MKPSPAADREGAEATISRMAAILAVPKAEVDALEAERPKRGQQKPKPKPKGDKKKGAA